MKNLLFIFAVILTSCGPNTITIDVKNQDHLKLSKQFGFQVVKPIYTTYYQGNYQAYVKKGNRVKHGHFKFFAGKGLGEEQEVIIYEGNFDHGLLDGALNQLYHFDDKQGLNYKWQARIVYDRGNCKEGSFTGNIGKEMPVTHFKSENLNPCSFDSLSEAAFYYWQNIKNSP